MAHILKGAPAAEAITDDLILRTHRLKDLGIIPALATVQVGSEPAALSYQTALKKRCNKIGIAVKEYRLSENSTQDDLLSCLNEINHTPSLHGCLLFRPLADSCAEAAACAFLAPEKDVDCMGDLALAALLRGQACSFAPCTAEACLELLSFYGFDVAGKNVVVIGRSLVIGKPVSLLLQNKNATVTMCHSQTKNLPALCRCADIVVSAAGNAHLLTKDYVSPNHVIIDVGINTAEDGSLCGDVDFAAVEPMVSAITPVPGGVGSVTTAILCRHVIQAAEKWGKPL